MDVAVLIPVKPLSRAKSRLRYDIGDDAPSLVVAMMLDVVAACRSCSAVTRTIVVTDDPGAAEACRQVGAEVLPDGTDEGLNTALTTACRTVHASNPQTLIIYQPADCPAVAGADFAALAAAASGSVGPVFVPDIRGTGTTAVALPPGVARSPHYGPDSRQAHLAAGWSELMGPGWRRMRHDIDRLQDLRQALPLGLGQHTRHWLAQRAALLD